MIIYRLIVILFVFFYSCKKDDKEETYSPSSKIKHNLFLDRYENDINNYDPVDSISQDYE